MDLKIEKSVCVITPTVGEANLKRAIHSVENQTYKNIHPHLIVIDGPEYWEKTLSNMVLSHEKSNAYVTVAPFNTGKNGMYGHRILAGYPHFIDADYIAFLDADNWWEENHIESLVNKIESESSLDWVHSLRKVYENGKYLADDCCEAIGRWGVQWTANQRSEPEQYLVDTSSYLFKTKWLINYSQLWHWGWGGDRRFFMMVKDHSNYDTSGLHTLNYELPDMDKAYGGHRDIFDKFNVVMKQRYGGKYPWRTTENTK